MATPIWQAGTLYQPGDLVRPASATGGAATPPDNPDFEIGTFTDWTVTPDGGAGSGAVSTTFKFTGSKSFLWAGGGGSGEGGGIGCFLINNLKAPVSPGQSITAHCYSMSVPFHRERHVHAGVRLFWFDISNNPIPADSSGGYGSPGTDLDGYGQYGGGFGTTGQWRQSSITAVAPSGAAFVSIGAFLTSTQGDNNGAYVDTFTWNYISPAASDALVFRAVQAVAGYSGSQEPAWPVVLGETVYDNEVVWEAVATSRVVWQASPILVSGSTEPDFPDQIGGSVVDNTIVWQATSRRIEDERCPHSKIVAIAASKIFAGDDDIVAYCSTTNPLDWSTPNDAGYLPFGLQTYGANPVAALGLYRSNLVASNAIGYQMWQVDPNPANMAILDAQPIPFTHHLTLQPAANDLVGLTSQGIRSIGVAGGSTNLQAGFFGKQVDALVQPLLKAAIEAGFEPWALLWPAQGQYWCFFGSTAVVLTMNGGEKDMSWSRYVFPYDVTDWCIEGTTLFLRAGDLVWEVSDEANDFIGCADDVYCDISDAPVLSNVRVSNSNHLSWTEVVGATGYRLYRADTNALIVDTPSLSHIDADLLENTDYTYYVVAYDPAGGVSPHSNTVDGPIGGPMPPALTGQVQSDSMSILLEWSGASTTGGPLLGYKVYDADTDTLITTISNPATLQYLDTGLEVNTIYSYYVKSYTAQTISAPSNTVVLDTGAPDLIIDVYGAGTYTWTKRPGLVSADVTVIGAGGGGASGGGDNGGHGGGGGGGGGAYVHFSILASFLGATETVTVGSGGNGGPAVVVKSGGVFGVAGFSGTNSSFGAWATADGGSGGIPATGAGPSAAQGGFPHVTGSSGPTSVTQEKGGDGPQGGSSANPNTTNAGAAGGAGGSAGGDGHPGGVATNMGVDPYHGNDGAQGGKAHLIGAGEAGFAGNQGGGGGGGGAALSSDPFTGPLCGAGGGGGDGRIVVWNYFV